MEGLVKLLMVVVLGCAVCVVAGDGREKWGRSEAGLKGETGSN